MIVNQGDVLEMHATNGLNDTVTSLHHHGMYFNGTSYFDGAVGVSQWSVALLAHRGGTKLMTWLCLAAVYPQEKSLRTSSTRPTRSAPTGSTRTST